MKEKENRNAPDALVPGLTWKVSANVALNTIGYSFTRHTECKKWKISFIMN